jgi:hypothetical protein
MEISPFEPNTVYYGSQYVHRTTDGGVTWEKISPDLTAHPEGTQYASGEPITRDATGEEVYSTVYSIRESPLQKGVIWSGSNDGLVYVTKDDGKSWTNVTPPDLAPGGRVQNIEPGRHHAGTAYVAIYRYLLGDFAPYIYRTDDYGKTWMKLTNGNNGIAADEPTRVVREDPDREGLLYAGTEFGIYISFNNGVNWKSFQLNLPVVPVTDIKVAHKDLVISTQGRSFWILDNLTVLHQLKPESAEMTNILYMPRTAIRVPANGNAGRGPEGPQYPLMGAEIDYYLARDAGDSVILNILDPSGKVVRSFTSIPSKKATSSDDEGGDEEEGFRPTWPTVLDSKAGMHRFTWDLRYTGAWMSDAVPVAANGPVAVPGAYQIQLSVGSWSSKQPLTVVEDPRVTKDGVTTADLTDQFSHNIRVLALLNDVNHLVARVKAEEAKIHTDKAEASDKGRQLQALSDKLITPKIRYSQPALQTHVAYLYSMTTRTDQKVGRDAAERYAELKKQVDEAKADMNRIVGSD